MTPSSPSVDGTIYGCPKLQLTVFPQLLNCLPATLQGRGPYPTYVTVNGTDKVVPVVQAFAYTKYMGHLRLNFDPATGELLSPVQERLEKLNIRSNRFIIIMV